MQLPPVGGGLPPRGADGHICQHHPVTDHNSGWRQVSISNGPVIPNVVLVGSAWEILHRHTESNFTNQNVTVTISAAKSVEHTCSVGGVVSYGGSVELAGTALFASLTGTASSNVEFNATFTSTYKENIEIESSTIIPPGKTKTYKFEKLKKEAKGAMDTYDHKVVCRYIPHGFTSDTANYCNKSSLSGNAFGWAESKGTWTEENNVQQPPGGGGQ